MTVFGPIFVPAELGRATSDLAWLEAMLEAERALSLAESRLGIIPAEAAAAIAEGCRAELSDIEELSELGRVAGNPVEPLVRALRERVGGEAADYVHWGATSQVILDTAAMLLSRRAVELILGELEVSRAAADLAEWHARTQMVARTLLQQASPTTFGYTPEELDAAFDPCGYVGSAPELVDSVLALYRASVQKVAVGS